MTFGISHDRNAMSVKQGQLKESDWGTKNTDDVIEYYNSCWLNRFSEGHNPTSYAMHFGLFRNEDDDNDKAKIQTNQLLAEALGIPFNEACSVADMGCGVGGTCMFLAERHKLAKIHGINISEPQLQYARGIISAKNLDGQVEFRQRDYRDTGLLAASMDYAFALESLWHAEVKIHVFNEANRILRSGGVFVVIDYFQTAEAKSETQQKNLKLFNNGWGAYELGTGPILTYNEDYENELLQVGFKDVKSESLLSFVHRGIIKSYEKAIVKIEEDHCSGNLLKHYQACIALKELVDNNLMDYRIVVAKK